MTAVIGAGRAVRSDADPCVSRLDLSGLGVPTVRAVFSHEAGLGATAMRTDLQSLACQRRRTRR